ncbi:DUF4258 domain-containing protein [Actinomyces faecalis]|uniref:DUF4258 domain-containing protein n=1 Tax=Actinomyces faecalis TaxID=2722820 RepID=UPI0015571D2E
MRLTYRYSKHGRQRARGRSITHEEIDQALNNPERTEPGNAPDRMRYVSHPMEDGYRIVVVASHPPNYMGVVTIVTCIAKSPNAPR